MGLFTYVEIPPNYIPEKYKGYTHWQTKDVIKSHLLGTLTITKSGELFYNLPFFIGQPVPHPMNYTGDIKIYASRSWFPVELSLTFKSGILTRVKKLESEAV